MLSRALITIVTVFMLATLAIAKPDNAVTEGRLDAIGPDGQTLGPCPLKHTEVDVDISGMIARVKVTQQFHNPFDDKIEAVYVFPLHQDSAVDAMTMHVGNRVVKGQIKERGEAQRIYEQAKAAGKVASLLDQERPNIFTQSVANIEPGEQVTITIEYSQTLKWEDGRYSFDFPTVVGPRYIPGNPQDDDNAAKANDDDQIVPDARTTYRDAEGNQFDLPTKDGIPVREIEKIKRKTKTVPGHPAKPTDQVPDADRITPPVIEEGMRAGHDLSIRVTLNAGLPIRQLESDQHAVDIAYLDDAHNRAQIMLRDKAVIPNRDFVLTWKTAQQTITDALLTHTDERGKFFTLILQPPDRVKPEQIVPRELIFVLDSSGSMNGFPMETSKSIMRRAIRSLRPQDRFNLITFAGNTAMLFEHAVENNEANRQTALRFVDSLKGAGGTEMMKAINEALGGEHDADTVRIVCFLTDGYVGNDMAIIDAVKENAGVSRVFSFGIGSSVNRFLLDKMAHAGRGEATYVLNQEQASSAAETFYQHIDAPVLTDIELDFGDLAVEQVYPRRVADLFAARPVIVKGRYQRGGEGVITLRGRTPTGRFERPIVVNLPAEEPEHDVLASQWARAKVDDLMMRDYDGAQRGNIDEAIKKQIIALGIEYDLMTQFTSFVAVEERHITEGGETKTIRVPVEMPEGVSYEGVFGGRQPSAARPMSLQSQQAQRLVGLYGETTRGIGARFYAKGGGASKIVYVVDASGSMAETFQQVLHELKRSINNLSKNHRFTIIFFQDGKAIEVPPRGWKAGNSDLKKSTIKWFAHEAGNVTPRGHGDASAGLKLAVRYQPEMIFLLSDGLSAKQAHAIDEEALMKRLNELNADRKIKISTIDFGEPDASELLKEIAKQHGGTYKHLPKKP